MKKFTQKYIAKCFLGIFIFNVIITPQSKSIAIPSVIAAPAAEVLVQAGFALYAIVASYLTSKSTHLSNTEAPSSVQTIQKSKHSSRTTPVVVPFITEKVINQVAKQAESAKTGAPHLESKQIESVKTFVNSIAKASTNDIAKNTLDKLINEPCKCATSLTINPISIKAAFQTKPIPYGIQLQTADGKLFIPIQFISKSIVNALRIATILACKNLQIMRNQIRSNPIFRNIIVKDVHTAIDCVAKTQTGNLADRIEACLMMDKLYIHAPIFNEFVQTVEELKKIYFHQDGSICFKAFYNNTKAPSIITNLINKIHQQLGHTIGRNELIDATFYQELKSLSFRSSTGKTGISCSCKKDYSCTGKQFNQDVLALIESCKKYDFANAQRIQQLYPKCWQFQNIIEQHKAEHLSALNTMKNTIYDANGIVQVSHNDPAYIGNKDTIIHATSAEKEIINQNLLVRYHLKEKMHEQWKIPQSAPKEIHKAIYQILNEDCSALSDISLLQDKIENVIKAAPKEHYDTLIRTFYESNGVIKEYVLHIPEAKNITLSDKILTHTYETERHKLNTLLCMQIKHPLQASQVKQTIQSLGSWLNARDTKSQITAKFEFNKAYEAVMMQEPIVKMPPQSQNQEIIDVNSSSPIPPEFEPENNNTETTQTSSPDLIYDNNATDNDLHHIFGRAKHNLDKFLGLYDGNKVKAYEDIYDEIFKQVKNKGIRGLFNREVIELQGIKLYVNGIVLPDGTVKIGTAFIP